MHIGLIGGIGVAATIVYYQRLTAAVAAGGMGPLQLTIAHGNIQELSRNNLADKREEQAQAFLPLVQRLGKAGCDVVALTSLGAHFCFDELAALSPLPLISGVEPLDTYFAAQGIGCVGLLGTRRVMRTRLYGRLSLTRALALDEEIDTIGQAYLDMAMAGRCSPDQRALFLDAGQRLMEAGAEAIVLAGTDLSLAFDGQQPGYPIIDALDVHVSVLAELAGKPAMGS
ncbi:MAG: aspartate racemase [Methylobacterium sp.]|nr:MAG: aspartate racemase [Methylobacterium sp.]